jgi:hypothetical protein
MNSLVLDCSSVARVAELADAPDLGSGALGRGGSSPLSRTIYIPLQGLHQSLGISYFHS